MTFCYALSFKYLNKKGQLKIQEMAFVLVALMVFFALVSMVYFSIRFGDLKNSAQTQRETEARELVKKLASTPEFAWTSSSRECASCVDFDKIIELKDRKSYGGFWKLDYLAVERVFPTSFGECTKANYPNCNTITLISNNKNVIKTDAFVALCFWQGEERYVKCELGKIVVASKEIK